MGRGVCDRIALNNLHSVASFFTDTQTATYTHTHKDSYSHVSVVVRGRCCSPLQAEATKNICTHARVCTCITHVHMPACVCVQSGLCQAAYLMTQQHPSVYCTYSYTLLMYIESPLQMHYCSRIKQKPHRSRTLNASYGYNHGSSGKH